VPFGNGFAVQSTGHFGPKVPMNHTPQRPVTSESTRTLTTIVTCALAAPVKSAINPALLTVLIGWHAAVETYTGAVGGHR
jgi:hypothetical protein